MLSELLTALGEYVGDVIVNDCGQPVPRVLRYHNVLPEDCCTDDGILSIGWMEQHVTSRFPAGGGQCPGLPVATIRLRYVTCWPVPETNASGVPLFTDDYYTRCDIVTARLADTADCVLRHLNQLACVGAVAENELAQAVIDLCPSDWIQAVDVAPLPNMGGCTGVQWRVYAGVRSGIVLS